MQFKIYLQNNDHNGAITQIQAMPASIDFTPDFLSLSAHEAIACRAFSVAVDSLSHLLTFFSTGKPMPTAEVIVFRTLIAVLIQQPQKENEVLKYMKRAHTRFSDLGPEQFFGLGEVGRRERNWFALNLWNIGLKSGQDKNYELCAELFRLCAEYYGVSIDGETEGNNLMVCKSIVLAVSAMLAGEKLSNDPLTNNEVKQAIDLLERAGKVLIRYGNFNPYERVNFIIFWLDPARFNMYKTCFSLNPGFDPTCFNMQGCSWVDFVKNRTKAQNFGL